MKDKKENDGLSSTEDASVHREVALGVNKPATFGDTSLSFNGVIYRHWVNKPDAIHHGWSYVGETPDEKTRLRSWNKKLNLKYAGRKLVEARETYPLEYWEYEVLEVVYAASNEELKTRLYERETFYITKYDSYEHGFNGNRGGCGNKGVKFDEARCKQNGDNRRGKPQSDETKKQIGEKLKGRRRSDETRVKIGNGNRGKKRSEEQRAAQSTRMKGKEPKAASIGAAEWREKHGGGYWGNNEITEEMRANMKAAQQARGIRIKAIPEDEDIICFPTMLDCAKYYKMGAGSISNFVKTGNLSKVAKARFEVISNEEYQEWLSSQS